MTPSDARVIDYLRAAAIAAETAIRSIEAGLHDTARREAVNVESYGTAAWSEMDRSQDMARAAARCRAVGGGA